jgi:hypothetical protein
VVSYQRSNNSKEARQAGRDFSKHQPFSKVAAFPRQFPQMTGTGIFICDPAFRSMKVMLPGALTFGPLRAIADPVKVRPEVKGELRQVHRRVLAGHVAACIPS